MTDQIGEERNSLQDRIFIVSVVLITALPSGSLAGFPLKYVLLSVVMFYFVMSVKRLSISLSAHLIGISGFLILYAIYGYAEFSRYAINELILSLGAVGLGLLVTHIVYARGFGKQRVLTIYKASVLLLAGVKLVVMALYLISPGYDAFVEEFVASYENITGASFLTMPLPLGLVRIYMQADLIAALLPLAVVLLRTKNRITSSDRAMVVVAMFVVLIGFSRYNMVCYGLCLFVFCLADKKGVWFKILLFCMVLFSSFLLFDSLREFVEVRFFSTQNDVSDEVRFSQTVVLINYFEKAPLFGHGLGAFSTEMIRSTTAPFSYEQQLLSFLPKFGVFGFLMFLSYVYIAIKIVASRQYYLVMYLALFVSASFFNPYFFSSNMLVVYLLIYYLCFYDAVRVV
ncbi:O-antigen ligase family protein [Salinicola tamaricis]|uniref:O-antigen ligase family protein n=1 Tax=Salinicola tamaricis TaxID=1771309 RepID=UPI000D0A0633|nr:O-antigen ligase family protein [Salinicola tamaricis]